VALEDPSLPSPGAVLLKACTTFSEVIETMMQTWHRFRRLRAIERWVVLEASAELPVAWLAMRLLGFRICKSVLTQPSVIAEHSRINAPTALGMARRIAHLEAVTAANLFFRATCLEQSLVLCWMLRRRGMNPELRIGARKEASRFEAHAWVELNGTVLDAGGAEHLHFAPFKHSDTSMETQTH
jgi:hypothetical protein